MNEVGGLYLMSIYESSLAVQYFSPTACCRSVVGLTLSEFCEKFQAKCKSQPKHPKMQNLNFTKSLLTNQNIKKSSKTIKKQPEMREKCARCYGNHCTRDYEVPGALTTRLRIHASCAARQVIKYEYFLQLPKQKNCLTWKI